MEDLETRVPSAFIPHSQWEPYKCINIQLMHKPADCPTYTNEQALEENEHFSKEVQKAIDLITTQKGILPVGSAKFKVHSYPSDIDIFEKVEGCCTINEVRLALMSKIQHIVQYVAVLENVLFGDLKAGYDERYDVYFGDEHMGKVIDYNQDIAILAVENLRSQKLLTKKEYEKFVTLLEPTITIETFEELETYLNEFYVLRWTPDEILRGYKQLLGGKRVYLFDALISHSVVKLDLWIPLPYEDIHEECLDRFRSIWDFERPERYVEVTNWILIQLRDEDGEIQTLSEELPNYARSLRMDVWHYLNKNDFNALKAAKRFWSYLLFQRKMLLTKPQKAFENLTYARKRKRRNQRKMATIYSLDEVDTLIKDIAPLFGSYIALLNAMKGDLEVISDILTSDAMDVDKEYLQQSLDGMQLRLQCQSATCTYDPVTQQSVLKQLQNLKNDPIPKAIDAVVNFIQDIINEKTKQYLNSKNIHIKHILFPHAS